MIQLEKESSSQREISSVVVEIGRHSVIAGRRHKAGLKDLASETSRCKDKIADRGGNGRRNLLPALRL